MLQVVWGQQGPGVFGTKPPEQAEEHSRAFNLVPGSLLSQGTRFFGSSQALFLIDHCFNQ